MDGMPELQLSVQTPEVGPQVMQFGWMRARRAVSGPAEVEVQVVTIGEVVLPCDLTNEEVAEYHDVFLAIGQQLLKDRVAAFVRDHSEDQE